MVFCKILKSVNSTITTIFPVTWKQTLFYAFNHLNMIFRIVNLLFEEQPVDWGLQESQQSAKISNFLNSFFKWKVLFCTCSCSFLTRTALWHFVLATKRFWLPDSKYERFWKAESSEQSIHWNVMYRTISGTLTDRSIKLGFSLLQSVFGPINICQKVFESVLFKFRLHSKYFNYILISATEFSFTLFAVIHSCSKDLDDTVVLHFVAFQLKATISRST